MTLCLIVNSDDYGRNLELSRGIREAHLNGIVTSATCMMNFAPSTDAIQLALEETPRLGLGVHLVMTSGSPVLPPEQVPSLVDSRGEFWKLAPFRTQLDQIDPWQAKAEWRAQIELFIEAAGRKPTHLDSHHHSSYYNEGLFRSMLELAQEYHVPIRPVTRQGFDGVLWGLPYELHPAVNEFAPRLLAEFGTRSPDAFYGTWYDDLATIAELERILDDLPASGIFEMMCHPGYVDADMLAASVYARERETELALLTDPAVKELILSRGIQLVTYQVLS